MGKDAAEEALIDMVCEGVKDARGPVVQFAFAPNQRGFAQQLPQQTARHLGCFEAILAKSGGSGVVLSGLSVADVLLAELTHELLAINPGILATYPLAKVLHDKV